jgi:glutamine---fructose-6-phosphate transaminase (isomerizing)
MCGIIGYVGRRPCKDLLLAGLERLEYRGYDSAGIALLVDDGLQYSRAVGPLPNLKRNVESRGLPAAVTGLGHTRWATHGGVTEANAHPLTGCDARKLSIVLNGIVENYRELKETLQADGHDFSSQTDAETVSHLIERHYEGDLVEAVRRAYEEMEGHFTFVAIHAEHPDLLVGARLQTPLVVGIGEGEVFLASNAAAFLTETRKVYFPDDGDIVAITPEGATFQRSDGTPVSHELVELDWDVESAEKGGFETFMLKEIYEQPEAVAETIGDRVRHGKLELDGLGLTDEELRGLRRIVILATGTAYHAGVTARYVLEEWARIPVEHDIASEWLYRNPVVGLDTLVIGISQSGETRDTISAMRLAREKGAHTLAVTNMMGAQLTREVDSVLYTRAGLEISVCATKTFTAQVALFYLIALKLAQVRGTLAESEIQSLLDEMHGLPDKMEAFLNADYQPISEIAQHHYDKPFFLYLGRNIGLPICLEGALKLKEISYIPTEAYSAGEMKHGPIALLDEHTPVVVVATDSHVYDKIASNIQECRARGAKVVAIATDGNEDIQHHADDVIFIPRTHPLLQAVLAVVPLQLLAYETARLRGLNIDQPRNLAKTVTVE